MNQEAEGKSVSLSLFNSIFATGMTKDELVDGYAT